MIVNAYRMITLMYHALNFHDAETGIVWDNWFKTVSVDVLVPPIAGSWWRHQREASSVLLAICVGNSPVTGEFPSKRASNTDFNVSLIWVRISC